MSAWHMDICFIDALEYIDISDCAYNRMISRMIIEIGFEYQYSSFDYMFNKTNTFEEIRELFKS